MTTAAAGIWLRLLPDSVRRRLQGREALVQIARNAGWLIADKVVRLGVGVVLNIWIARYLGPERFGLLSYTQAIAVMLSFLSTLGLPDVVIRDLARMADADGWFWPVPSFCVSPERGR